MKRIMVFSGMVLALAFAFGIYSGATASFCFGAEAIGVDTHAEGGGTKGAVDKGAQSRPQNMVGGDKSRNLLSGPAIKDTGTQRPVFETYGLGGDYQRGAR